MDVLAGRYEELARRPLPGHRFVTSWFWRLLPTGMSRHWWLFRLFDLIARHWPVPGKRHGILVVRVDSIANMVLFRRTLDAYADVLGVDRGDITVLGCTSWAPISDTVFADYRRLLIDAHAFTHRPFYRFRMALLVRRLRPALTLCDSYFRRALIADSLVWIAGAPQSVVSLPYITEQARAEFTYYLSQLGPVIDTGLYPTHEIVRHYKFLSALAGREIQPEPPRINWRDVAPAVAADGPYVVLNPGSNEIGRRWPFANYLDIAGKLLARGLRIVIVGSDDEHAGDAGTHFAGDPRVIDLAGKLGLREVLDVLKHAAGVISNDTDTAHLAIALGTPTIVIVGGGYFGSSVPYPPAATPTNARFVFEEMPCYHCFWNCRLRTSRFEVFPCVDAVPVETVWREIDALIPHASAA